MSFTGIEHATHIRFPRVTRSLDAELCDGLRPTAVPDKSLRSIVVPLDGTDFAEHALPLAVAIARRSGAILRLVRVFSPADTAPLCRRSAAFDIIESHLRIDSCLYLSRVHRRIAARARNLSTITHLAETPVIVDGIGRFSETADLVVMATHGRGWLRRLVMGSVAHELLRNRGKATLLVRGYDSPVDFAAESIPRHIAVALDGRRDSERSLDAAGTLARLTGANTTLLHVDEPPAVERFPHGTSEGYLNWVRMRNSETADVATHVVRDASSPARGILSFVEESDVDLLAITTRAAPPAFRSTTETLIRKSPVPVLVVGEELLPDEMEAQWLPPPGGH